MKIGIITFQNAVNYGAALQTYALNKYMAEAGAYCRLGADYGLFA